MSKSILCEPAKWWNIVTLIIQNKFNPKKNLVDAQSIITDKINENIYAVLI